MPLLGPVPEGGTFFCPHCGAMYSVTLSRLPKTDRNIANCVVCGQTMDERDSSKVSVYKLIHRPEDANRLRWGCREQAHLARLMTISPNSQNVTARATFFRH